MTGHVTLGKKKSPAKSGRGTVGGVVKEAYGRHGVVMGRHGRQGRDVML